jgi:hypothetical protein
MRTGRNRLYAEQEPQELRRVVPGVIDRRPSLELATAEGGDTNAPMRLSCTSTARKCLYDCPCSFSGKGNDGGGGGYYFDTI